LCLNKFLDDFSIALSPKSYNDKVGLALLCSITNQVKGCPFEAMIPSGLKGTGGCFIGPGKKP